MKNNDMNMHVRGASIFVDDIVTPEGCLHAALYTSRVARGIIHSLDISKAAAAPGVVAVYTHRDIPGLNQVGHVSKDQPLLAVDKVEYIGQPIALIVAQTRRQALLAAKLVTADIEQLEAVFDPRVAFERGMIHGQKSILVKGDTSAAFAKCKYIVQGTQSTGPQEHFYFETQRALAIPEEHGTIKVCASSQSPGAFHRHIAEVLGIPQSKVEFDIRRLGGAFGGKESTAVWVVAPALAAFILKKPVKLVLTRNEDIFTTGKRHAYEYDYKIGLDAEGNILAYEVILYQHAGACADISIAVLTRSLLHASGSYRVPNISVTAVSCRTNIPPNNAFRGFGVPQGTFGIEYAITKAAEIMGVDVTLLKHKNLLRDGDTLPYGMKLEKVNAIKCWETLDKQVNIAQRYAEVEKYNMTHTDTKRGIAVIPVCFGISFAQTALNQASSLVNIYVDGSVAVSTGAVEMGQGVNTKIQIIAANTLGISTEKVRLGTTNTLRIPNASPTSASTGADLNGMATKFACEELYTRLKKFAAKHLNHNNPDEITLRDNAVYINNKKTELDWEKLVAAAQWARIDLSCHAFYATPNLHLDPKTFIGRPFAYYSYGTSLTSVILDVRRGTYVFDGIDVVHDVGQTLSEAIDRGQVEGAVIQGMGWSTIEQIRYSSDGRVLTGVNAYKIPDIKFCPSHFKVTLLPNSDNPYAVCNSKAVGEPPFIHGLGAYFAILHALRAVRKDKELPSLPLTPEKVFMYIHS
ncbi:MAG: putative xanthine dehydrogenase subunit D [Elusimicrobia bacterium ADurb.Bin231]|nr:MAG: putative xanthine dehydrogenase subunit D [Elusimicrobia bacterium ADurb.Bin231]